MFCIHQHPNIVTKVYCFLAPRHIFPLKHTLGSTQHRATNPQSPLFQARHILAAHPILYSTPLFLEYFLFNHTKFIPASYPGKCHPWMKIVIIFTLALLQLGWERKQKWAFFPENTWGLTFLICFYLQKELTSSVSHKPPFSQHLWLLYPWEKEWDKHSHCLRVAFRKAHETWKRILKFYSQFLRRILYYFWKGTSRCFNSDLDTAWVVLLSWHPSV